MIAPEFLDLEEVLEIHALQLDEFGGIAGVRDRGLLESAVEQPRATAFGELLHADLFEIIEPSDDELQAVRRDPSAAWNSERGEQVAGIDILRGTPPNT